MVIATSLLALCDKLLFIQQSENANNPLFYAPLRCFYHISFFI
nr:MAG TPA_asm: hypothetical protein [Caudoviricetes sp.]